MFKKVRKNKKGFTLTELIAVIVILGVLSTLVIVGVTRYIKNARMRTYESYEATMKKAAENMMVECASGKENCYNEVPEVNEKNKIGYSKLLNNGYIEKLKDPEKDGNFCNGYVEVSNNSTDNVVSNLSYKSCLSCSNYHTGDSTCEFEENEDVIEEDRTYALCDTSDTEEDCCAKFSNSLSEDSKFTTWVNTDRTIKFGCLNGICKYQRTFNLSDGEKIDKGQVEISAGKNVYACDVDIKIDKVKPTCSIVPKTAVAMNNGWYSSDVTMELHMNDNGKTIQAYGISTNSKPVYNSDTEIVVGNGITTVFGYVKDSLGNEGRCDREVKVDNHKPEQQLALGYRIYPENKNQIISTTNKLTIQNLGRYESVKGIVIYLKNQVNGNIIVSYKKDGNVQANSTIISSNSLIVNNILSSDKLIDSVEINVDSSKIDKVYLIVGNSKLQEYTNKDMIVYIYGSQDVLGIASTKGYSFDGGSTWQDEAYKEFGENQIVVTKVKGTNGTLSNNSNISIFQIDKDAPTIPTIVFKKWSTNNSVDRPNYSNGNYVNLKNYTPGTWSDKKIFTLADGSVDNGPSGFDHYEYTTSGVTTNNENEISNYRNVEANGESTIKYRACDKAGNCSSYTPWYTIKIDTLQPDIKVTAYKLNDDNTIGSSLNSVQNASKLVAPDGDDQKWVKYRLHFKVEASSFSAIDSLSYKIYPGKVQTYTALADKEAEARVVTKTYSSNNIVYEFDFNDEGARKIVITVTSKAGTTRTINVYGKIDRTMPTCNGINKTTTYSSLGVSGYIGCKDGMSGCEKATYSFNGLKTSSAITIKDKAENTKSCNVVVNSGTCGNNNCNSYEYRDSCFDDNAHNTPYKCKTLEGDSAIFNSSNKTCCVKVRYCASYNSTYTCYY